jgi:ribosome-dependent ATPase
MLTPVSALEGPPWVMGHLFPMTYFVPVCVGTYTKGLAMADVAGRIGWMSLFIPILFLLSLFFLPKQER